MCKKRKGRNSAVRYWHCNYCGKGRQDISRTTCEECGRDLNMFGTVEEIENEEPVVREHKTEIKDEKVTGSGEKKNKIRKIIKRLAVSLAVIVVIILIFGVLGSVIDPEPDPVITTKTRTTTTEKSDAVVPDFLDFANGYAEYHSTESGETWTEYYYKISGNAKLISKEYAKLIDTHYHQYKLINELDWYGYEYNGNKKIKNNFWVESENYDGNHFAIDSYTEDGDEYIRLILIDGITFEKTDERTSYNGSKAYFPSFATFASLDIHKKWKEDNEIIYEYIMPLRTPSGDYTDYVVNDYVDLILDNYPYRELGQHQVDADNWVKFFWFEYTGDAEVTDRSATINADGTKMNNYNFVIYVYEQENDILVRICTAPEIEEIDNGEVYEEYR